MGQGDYGVSMLRGYRFAEIDTLQEMAEALRAAEVIQGERNISVFGYEDSIPYKEVLARVVHVVKNSIQFAKMRDLQKQVTLYRNAQFVVQRIGEFSQSFDRPLKEILINVACSMFCGPCCFRFNCYSRNELSQEEILAYWIEKHFTSYY